LIGLLAACGCSTVIGADFDVEYDPSFDHLADGSGGLSGVGGSTSSTGAQASGGVNGGTGGIASGGANVGGTGSVATGGAATGGAATGGAGTGGTQPGCDDPEGDLVINEIYPGGDLIEIYNRGTGELSIEYFWIAQADPDDVNGCPLATGSTKLAQGTKLAADGFEVFDSGMLGFDITRNQTFFLLDGSNNVVAKLELPDDDIDAGWSYIRTVDGGEIFGTLPASPGNPNQ
jgi:hypothetical protein